MNGLRSLAGAGAATAIGAALLIGLGVWQLHRLAWKEALLAEIYARAKASAESAPAPAEWPSLKPSDYEYRHVRVHGVFDYAHQALVFRALGEPHGRYGGPGYLVMTPLKLDSGETVLVNRGFVPMDSKAEAKNGPAGPVEVTGLMRSSEDRTWFTPADDPAQGEWYTRDVEKIAAGLQIGPHAPFSIDEDAGADPAALPEGGETILAFPNNHLSYAIQWFGLAAALIGVFAAWAFPRLKAASGS